MWSCQPTYGSCSQVMFAGVYGFCYVVCMCLYITLHCYNVRSMLQSWYIRPMDCMTHVKSRTWRKENTKLIYQCQVIRSTQKLFFKFIYLFLFFSWRIQWGNLEIKSAAKICGFTVLLCVRRITSVNVGASKSRTILKWAIGCLVQSLLLLRFQCTG